MAKSESKFMTDYSDEEIIDSFFNSWMDGDPDDIKSALYSLIRRFGGTYLADVTGIPRTTLYDMCKDCGNPTLDNLCLIINFLKNKKVA